MQPADYVSGTMYEIREHLGDGKIFSFRQIVSADARVSVDVVWAMLEDEFLHYLGEAYPGQTVRAYC